MGICCTNATSCSGEISIACKCIGIIIVHVYNNNYSSSF